MDIKQMRGAGLDLVGKGLGEISNGDMVSYNWEMAAEICERLEGHNRNISILLSEIRKAQGGSEIPPNLDAAARLAGAWSILYSTAVQEMNSVCLDLKEAGPTKNQRAFHRNLARQADKAFAELCKISELATLSIVEVKENGDD